MDRRVYLHPLAAKRAAAKVSVLGHCLMGDHVHLVVMPAQAKRLARALSRTHWHYAPYVSHLHGRSGYLWQNRFHSCPPGPRHLHRAMRYVERDPVRVKLATRAWDHAWSSARVPVGLAPAAPPAGYIAPRAAAFHPDAKPWQPPRSCATRTKPPSSCGGTPRVARPWPATV